MATVTSEQRRNSLPRVYLTRTQTLYARAGGFRRTVVSTCFDASNGSTGRRVGVTTFRSGRLWRGGTLHQGHFSFHLALLLLLLSSLLLLLSLFLFLLFLWWLSVSLSPLSYFFAFAFCYFQLILFLLHSPSIVLFIKSLSSSTFLIIL